MSHLLRRGKDNSAAFQILEAYLLLQVRFFVVLAELSGQRCGSYKFFGGLWRLLWSLLLHLSWWGC
jgi:hypothetical protein